MKPHFPPGAKSARINLSVKRSVRYTSRDMLLTIQRGAQARLILCREFDLLSLARGSIEAATS